MITYTYTAIQIHIAGNKIKKGEHEKIFRLGGVEPQIAYF